MGIRLKNISELFSNLRTRNIIILTGVILLLAIVVGFLGLRRGTSESESQAKLGRIPGMQTTSGLETISPEVEAEIENLDAQRYQKARQGKGSMIPTVVGDENQASPDDFLNPTSQKPTVKPTKTQAEKLGLTPEQLATLQAMGINPNQVVPGQTQGVPNQSTQAQTQVQVQTSPSADAQAMQQAAQAAQQNIQRQAKALMTAWTGDTGTPTQFYQEGQVETVKAETTTTTTVVSKPTTTADGKTVEAEQGPATIKSGDIVFAVLNTSINSDEPGPILATIVTGPFKGSRLVGGLQQTRDIPGTNGPTAVTLTFNSMNIPEQARSVVINAVGIDPDSARTALASDVDHHYMLRYGNLFASAFLEGYGNAITQSGEVIINDPAGGSTDFKQQLSPQQQLLAGLGTVGQRWGEQLGETFDRPNTIYVNAGISLGILFLSDVTIN